MKKLPVIGVMGSGTEAHRHLSIPLGRALARRRVHLLTGGGQGVMAAVAEAFCCVVPREGLSIGILPARRPPSQSRAPEGYPNDRVELAIHTHLYERGEHGAKPLSRNHINVLTSDVIIALPGGAGTMSEIRLALEYEKPIAAYGSWPQSLPAGVLMTERLDQIEAFIDNMLDADAMPRA